MVLALGLSREERARRHFPEVLKEDALFILVNFFYATAGEGCHFQDAHSEWNV